MISILFKCMVVPCLSISLQTQTPGSYAQVRVNEIPYAIGATELELDPTAAAAQLATLLKVTDEAEDDTFASGRVVESQVRAKDTHTHTCVHVFVRRVEMSLMPFCDTSFSALEISSRPSVLSVEVFELVDLCNHVPRFRMF